MKTPLFYFSLCIGLLSLSQCKKADPSACSAEEPCYIRLKTDSVGVYLCMPLSHGKESAMNVTNNQLSLKIFCYPYKNWNDLFASNNNQVTFYFFDEDKLFAIPDSYLVPITSVFSDPNITKKVVTYKREDVEIINGEWFLNY